MMPDAMLRMQTWGDEFIKCQGELMSDVRSGASWSAPVQCQEWETAATEGDTEANVMQRTQGRQGRRQKELQQKCSGETRQSTRLIPSLTAVLITQIWDHSCRHYPSSLPISPSPCVTSPAEFYSDSPGARAREKQLPATRPVHRRHFLSAILILTLLSALSAAFLAPVQLHEDTQQSWCSHESYRSIRN